MLAPLHRLPTASLRALSSSLSAGMLSAGISRFAVQQSAGADAPAVEGALRHLEQLGMSAPQIAVVVQSIAEARDSQPDPAALFDLVLSGPEMSGVPTADTAAVVHTLITRANRDILLVGYAIHNGRRLFEPLATRMAVVPDLRVTFCIDIARHYGDTSLDTEVVKRFAMEFRSKHWPWPKLPEVFYDPRSLLPIGSQRASLHAKCIVVDSEIALVTSANFTEAAQYRNIEVGILIRHRDIVERIASYFEGLRAAGQLIPCPLPP
jgi:phosphatidylserine/phosphatidylglycerophosphate/cardiolipin synthase-like enzyme